MQVEVNKIKYHLGLVPDKIIDSKEKKLSALESLDMALSGLYSFHEIKGEVYCLDRTWNSLYLKELKGSEAGKSVVGKFHKREEESSEIISRYCEIRLNKKLPFKKIVTLNVYNAEDGKEIYSERKIILRKKSKKLIPLDKIIQN